MDYTAVGINAYVVSVGYSYDNAMSEIINELYETELIRSRVPCSSLEGVEHATRPSRHL